MRAGSLAWAHTLREGDPWTRAGGVVVAEAYSPAVDILYTLAARYPQDTFKQLILLRIRARARSLHGV